VGVVVSGDDVDEIYTGILADIAKLARKLAQTDSYRSANGTDALLAFSDHLEGIVAAVGVNRSEAVRVPVRKKRDR
jgi:hypothetical protein